MPQKESRGTDRVQRPHRHRVREAPEDEVVPVPASTSPGQTFQRGPEIHGHALRVLGVPEEDDVAQREVRMAEAEGYAADLASLPRREAAVDTHMACVEAEMGQHGEPAVEDRAELSQIRDGLDAGDVDEGCQEAFAQVAVGIALAGETDDGLGKVAASVGLRGGRV